MKIAIASLVFAALSVAAPALSDSAHAAAARFAWHDTWTRDNEDYRVKDAVVDARGNVWILLTVRDKGSLLTQGELALWRLAPDGSRDRRFAVDRPTAHGARLPAYEQAFVRLSASGQPVVAARTESGISVVEVDGAGGAGISDWLVRGDGAPVAFQSRPGSGLTLITALRVYELEAKHAPRTVYGDDKAAPIVAGLPVRDRVALVAVDPAGSEGAMAHVGFLSDSDEKEPHFGQTALDLGATLRHNVSYATDDGLAVLAPVGGDSPRWRRLSFDAQANLTDSHLFELPPRDKRPLTLDAQPLGGGRALLAGAQGNGFWLGVLGRDGGVSAVALDAAPADGGNPSMFVLDVRLRATESPGEYLLLGTRVSSNLASRRSDYGVFASRVLLGE